MFCFCFLRASAPIFLLMGAQKTTILFCSTAQGIGYPSYATGRGQGFGKIWASPKFFGTHFDNLGRIAKGK